MSSFSPNPLHKLRPPRSLRAVGPGITTLPDRLKPKDLAIASVPHSSAHISCLSKHISCSSTQIYCLSLITETMASNDQGGASSSKPKKRHSDPGPATEASSSKKTKTNKEDPEKTSHRSKHPVVVALKTQVDQSLAKNVPSVDWTTFTGALIVYDGSEAKLFGIYEGEAKKRASTAVKNEPFSTKWTRYEANFADEVAVLREKASYIRWGPTGAKFTFLKDKDPEIVEPTWLIHGTPISKSAKKVGEHSAPDSAGMSNFLSVLDSYLRQLIQTCRG